ncbi:MAG: FG-GAP-like repeat-containing protein [Caldilineales bacterium]
MDPAQSLGSRISRHVALGDLDGDGDLDAFVANGSFLQTANKVWLNDGSGTFSDSGQNLGNVWSEQVALGDLDGDGDLDAVAANFNGASRVWINQGGVQGGSQGVFGSGPSLPGNALDVALADFDLDGDLDLALLDNGGARVSFWWNDSGALSAGPAVALPESASRLDAGPVTADGYPDVMVATSDQNALLRNQGGSGFNISPAGPDTNGTDVSLGDVDGDGDLDALFASWGYAADVDQVWLNDGDGNFTHAQTLGDSQSQAGVLADVTGDGAPDALLVAFEGTTAVWFNGGGGGGTQEQGPPFSTNGQELGLAASLDAALGDLDGDGDLDAFVAELGANQIWLNGEGGDPAGTFSEGQELEGDNTPAVGLGDLDGDGDPDAFVAGLSAIHVWLNGENGDPTGVFSAGQSLDDDHFNEDVALADLDGDGDLDAFVAGVDTSVWLNGQGGNPAGVFSNSGQNLPEARRVALADLDGDGDADSVLTTESGNQVWLNGENGQPPGRFSNSGQTFGGANTSRVALGDLDGDGDADAFVANQPGAPNEVWFNGEQGNPAGVFSNSGQTIDNVNSTDVTLIDLNGDGDLDAFIATGDGGVRSWSNLIWLNDGNGYGQVTGQCLGDTDTRALALGDLDGDGDPDAYAANIGVDRVWLNEPGEECSCVTAWLLGEPAAGWHGLSGTLDTFYALRDQVLPQTRRGRHFARVYDQHNAAVFSALLADSSLRSEAVTLLETWQPNLEMLVNGQGQNATITSIQVQRLRNFLNHLGAAGDEDLQGMIAFELAQLPPLSRFTGMTMAEAQYVVLKTHYRYLPVMPHR